MAKKKNEKRAPDPVTEAAACAAADLAELGARFALAGGLAVSVWGEPRYTRDGGMPKLGCICGYVHDLSPIPDDGWVLVRDTDYEELLAVEARREALSGAREGTPNFDALIEADSRASALTHRMYECPECGRLARDEGDVFKFFAPEHPQSPYRS